MSSMKLDEYKVITSPAEKKKARAKVQAQKLAQRVEVQLVNLPKFSKEFKFHPVRRWRFDYAWPELKVALEIHGGVFVNGRHTRGKGFTEDKVKMNSAQLLGWIVIEATTAQVKSGDMLVWINKAIAKRNNDASN